MSTTGRWSIAASAQSEMKECGIFDGMNVHPIWWNDCKHRFSQPISRLFQFCLVVVQVCDLSPRLIGRLADRLKSLGVVNGPRPGPREPSSPFPIW
jgi:hypothetical protein